MKILLILLGITILTACDSEPIKENPKIEKDLSALENLEETRLKDSFSEYAYTLIDFGKDGEFSGSYLSNSDLNKKDFGRKNLAEDTYNRPEIHRSVFQGKFTIKEDLGGGVYKLGLEEFVINNETGVDGNLPYQVWVDFAGGLLKDDDYYLYLSGARLSDDLIKNNQYDLEARDYEAFGPVLYNKSQGLVFTNHDMWAMDHSHE